MNIENKSVVSLKVFWNDTSPYTLSLECSLTIVDTAELYIYISLSLSLSYPVSKSEWLLSSIPLRYCAQWQHREEHKEQLQRDARLYDQLPPEERKRGPPQPQVRVRVKNERDGICIKRIERLGRQGDEKLVSTVWVSGWMNSGFIIASKWGILEGLCLEMLIGKRLIQHETGFCSPLFYQY